MCHVMFSIHASDGKTVKSLGVVDNRHVGALANMHHGLFGVSRCTIEYLARLAVVTPLVRHSSLGIDVWAVPIPK